MLKIKVTINDNADHLDILIPSDIKCSKKYSFYINTKLNECDYWFIIGRGQKIYEKVCSHIYFKLKFCTFIWI